MHIFSLPLIRPKVQGDRKALALSRAVRESRDCGSAVHVRFKCPQARNSCILEINPCFSIKEGLYFPYPFQTKGNTRSGYVLTESGERCKPAAGPDTIPFPDEKRAPPDKAAQ